MFCKCKLKTKSSKKFNELQPKILRLPQTVCDKAIQLNNPVKVELFEKQPLEKNDTSKREWYFLLAFFFDCRLCSFGNDI